mmetsp:Transcript_9499/g.25331  ORF Transcript_9499/g.25331 Transcript_9499/m.25331 type:complete len:302 (-) Transcript_9499:42-947(-)
MVGTFWGDTDEAAATDVALAEVAVTGADALAAVAFGAALPSSLGDFSAGTIGWAVEAGAGAGAGAPSPIAPPLVSLPGSFAGTATFCTSAGVALDVDPVESVSAPWGTGARRRSEPRSARMEVPVGAMSTGIPSSSEEEVSPSLRSRAAAGVLLLSSSTTGALGRSSNRRYSDSEDVTPISFFCPFGDLLVSRGAFCAAPDSSDAAVRTSPASASPFVSWAPASLSGSIKLAHALQTICYKLQLHPQVFFFFFSRTHERSLTAPPRPALQRLFSPRRAHRSHPLASLAPHGRDSMRPPARR